MKKEKGLLRIYDGAKFCSTCDQCPVVDYDLARGLVTLSDPAKPKKGRFTMTVEEYNTLLGHAKKI